MDELHKLLDLAERLASQGQIAEAEELLDTIKLLESRQPQAAETGEGPPNPEEVRRSLERETIDANHFFGLAMLYAESGKQTAAIECLQIAKEKGRVLPHAYKLHGRLLARHRDFDGAANELRKAQRFNPFDRQTAERLGQVEYERKNYREALAATIDAFLLLRDEDETASSRMQRRIRTLKRVLGWDNRALIRLFHERRQLLSTAFDRLQWRRELFFEERGLMERSFFGGPTALPAGDRIELASSLRQIDIWSHLPDESIFQLTRVVRRVHYASGEVIFTLGSTGHDMYFVLRGEVAVQRPTPYGSFRLRSLAPGDLVGEVNFVSGSTRTGEGVAVEDSELLRIDSHALHELIEENPEVGVEIYSSLWQTLAQKLRSTNDLLREFFPDDSVEVIPENLSPVRGADALGRTSAHVDSRDKIRLFREQGLSHGDLLTLATFSHERHYEAGTYLFREGDPGEEMFAIVEGRVRISKFIAGGGEEALSILDRGDFFGEMALIDGQPRSADAQTHRGPATVLVLDRATIREVLSMDAQAALEFLGLLCRLLASRLREIDDKVVMWQILAAHHSPAAGDTSA